jgi:hypothetical protein
LFLTQTTEHDHIKIEKKSRYRLNPLAVLIKVPESQDQGEADEDDDEESNEEHDEEEGNGEEDSDIEISESELLALMGDGVGGKIKYVLHINFGNESLDSLIRIVFYVPESLLRQMEFLRVYREPTVTCNEIPGHDEQLFQQVMVALQEHGFMHQISSK